MTLLAARSGLLKPASGSVRLAGRDLLLTLDVVMVDELSQGLAAVIALKLLPALRIADVLSRSPTWAEGMLRADGAVHQRRGEITRWCNPILKKCIVGLCLTHAL